MRSLNIKRMNIGILLLIIIVFCGVLPIERSIYGERENARTQNQTTAVKSFRINEIEEALYGVDLVIEGSVSTVKHSEVRNSGVGGKMSFQYDVTPVQINVENVVYGQEPDSTTITYLQHGIENESNSILDFVHEGDKVVLLLEKADDGKYWSYNFNDGIWKNVNGKVQSKSTNEILVKLNGEILVHSKH
ncbi:hypothetical protein GZH47_00135 [Paenibacillus rhizovicinus]|uniref:Uncharacterized protein n=1 Tax=Paenibacillus rhizovicinus TaxID=2704463 RepID=A0A6C0NTF5_9BACL|nr:hypothetical protein [Paenibacillus rhizovicinus]QHW29391.1 hypothetical protein GZH47_00135 [Paenibacillus rhizovicinus]